MCVFSTWGERLKISLFGESHGPAIGVVLDGLPAGELVDLKAVQAFLDRRSPGRAPWSTARKEKDKAEILSGIYQGRTTGTPLSAVIANKDARSRDYEEFLYTPRPGHADYTGRQRYRGFNDPRGGGHFSGRLTAPLCFAGAVAEQILARRGMFVAARIAELGGIADGGLNTAALDQHVLQEIRSKDFPVADNSKAREMIALIEKARGDRDSVGGVIQCFATGVPAGLGNPIFGGVESRLASIIYGIPAVKGVSFGDGFAVCRRRGSENNDSFYVDQSGRLRTRTNHEGGINGGISNGMPLVVNVAIKPTSSIGQPQASVDLRTMEKKTLLIGGRHDPCIVPRACPAVEAAVAVAMLDLFLATFGIQGRRLNDEN